MLKAVDTSFFWRALELARKGEGHTRPNPPVGAVLVKDGKIVGEGWHRRAGGDHAEVAAIKDAIRRLKTSGKVEKGSASVDSLSTFQLLSSSTLYVTLEPCSKPGRVGACTDAIVAAGIARVIYAVPDPNPTNRGRARRVLAKAGVSCVRAGKSACAPEAWDVCGGLKGFLAAAQRLIAPFAKHVKTGVPYVTVKLAMSLDGRICDDSGDAKWISSARSRRLVGRERASVDAIMVGAETVRKDNPSLLSHARRNDDLVRVIVTKSGKVPKNAQVLTDGKNPTLVCQAKGSLRDVLADLGARGIMHVLCEGGLKLATALADEGLVDRWIAINSPLVIGSRPISKALRFKLYEYGLSDVLSGDREGRYECLPD